MTGETLHQTIVGLGNPLLDICANVSQDFLDKYELKLDNAILAEEKHLPLYDEMVKEHQAEFVAGGATQNSIRIAQWLLKSKCATATSFIGCIGEDSFGKQLYECATKDGVNVHYLKDESTPTGTCAVCVKDGERSLVANLAAANNYKLDHMKSPESQKIIEQARLFYSAGFHLTVCPDAMVHLGEHAAEHNKIFAVNLSAPFIMQFFKDPLMKVIPLCDFVFGNENEATEFGKTNEWGEDLEVIALKLSQLPKTSGARGRVVVFTQGSKCTIVAKDGKVTKYDVPPMDAKAIVDTNGAGDAFVGGFLSQLVLEQPISECVRAGHYAAQVVIKQSGCTFPAESNFN